MKYQPKIKNNQPKTAEISKPMDPPLHTNGPPNLGNPPVSSSGTPTLGKPTYLLAFPLQKHGFFHRGREGGAQVGRGSRLVSTHDPNYQLFASSSSQRAIEGARTSELPHPIRGTWVKVLSSFRGNLGAHRQAPRCNYHQVFPGFEGVGVLFRAH